MVLETSGVDEAADSVVRQVAESQGDTSDLLEAPVDGFGRSKGGEVGQDVGGSFSQGPGQCLDLIYPVGDSLLQ